jgi:hypothetical protein
VLLNAPLGELEFGPNPLPAHASLPGAPTTTLQVKFTDGTPHASQGPHGGGWVDSGGVDGYIPNYLNPPLVDGEIPTGTFMSVYSPDGTLLYVQDVRGSTISPTTSFNTGIFPFYDRPIYVSYSPSGGTTVFDA